MQNENKKSQTRQKCDSNDTEKRDWHEMELIAGWKYVKELRRQKQNNKKNWMKIAQK